MSEGRPLDYNEVRCVANRCFNLISGIKENNQDKPISEVIQIIKEACPYEPTDKERISIWNETVLGSMGNTLPEKRLEQLALL